MTDVDALYEKIIARARIASGEEKPVGPPPASHRGRMGLDPSGPSTGTSCSAYFVEGDQCPDDAVVRLVVGRRSGGTVAACPRCYGRSRWRSDITVVERLA